MIFITKEIEELHYRLIEKGLDKEARLLRQCQNIIEFDKALQYEINRLSVARDILKPYYPI